MSVKAILDKPIASWPSNMWESSVQPTQQSLQSLHIITRLREYNLTSSTSLISMCYYWLLHW